MKTISKKSMLLVFTMLIAISFLFTGCKGGKKEAEATNADNKSEKKDVNIKLEGGDWGEPNPYKTYPRGPGMSKTNLIYDSLIEKDEKRIIPWLAEKWEVKSKWEGIFI